MHGSFEPANLAEEGRSLYQKGQYLAAAENFHAARVGFELKGDRYTAAEMANNCSVSYLLAKSASEALEELNGIEEYYSEIGDSMRQGITAGNAASALDALDRVDEAQSGYMRSAALLEKTGEDQLRANVMQSLLRYNCGQGVLFSLFTFVELLTQLDNVGKRNFHAQDAFFFVALTTPRRIYDLIPMSALLGSIIALGMLADRGELLAMQAAGVSVRRICGAALVTGALLIPAMAALGEFVAPPLEQSARTLRLRALADPGVLPTKQGFWARRGNSFIHVGKSFGGEAAADVEIFERDDQWRITRAVHASRATIGPDRRWLLQDVTERTIDDDEIKIQSLPSLNLDSFLSPAQVAVLKLPPDTMSGRDLYYYLRALRERGQNARTYALALWQKITTPVATGAS